MTDGYLSMECVVSNLVSHKIITPKKDWKNTAPSTRTYLTGFHGEAHPCAIVFQVHIIDGSHCISKTAFINQAHYLRIDTIADSVLTNCILP
jgi:hypothetical protein